MLPFLEAGFIAGTRQLLAVILVTSAAFLTDSEKVVSGTPELWPSVSVLLTWAYLLIAIGLALTQDRPLVLTAKTYSSRGAFAWWEAST